MEDTGTRTCPHCAETMSAAARVCPHCRRERNALRIPSWVGMLLFVPIVFTTFVALPVSFLWQLRPSRDFGPFQRQLEVLDSSVRRVASSNQDFVVVVGSVSNASPYPWRALQLEAQFFGPDGKLVDTASQVGMEDEILPGETRGFKIRTEADQPASAYASHKVFVRAAREPRNQK